MKKKTTKPRKHKCGKCNKLTDSKKDICPYSKEINDTEIICNCCSDCRYECLEGWLKKKANFSHSIILPN